MQPNRPQTNCPPTNPRPAPMPPQSYPAPPAQQRRTTRRLNNGEKKKCKKTSCSIKPQLLGNPTTATHLHGTSISGENSQAEKYLPLSTTSLSWRFTSNLAATQANPCRTPYPPPLLPPANRTLANRTLTNRTIGQTTPAPSWPRSTKPAP